MQAVFDEYAVNVDAYNILAEKYNEEYEKAKTDNTVIVPDIPCAPTIPTNAQNLKFEYDTSKYDEASQRGFTIAKDTIFYTPLNLAQMNSSTEAKYDNRRFGHLYTNADASGTLASEYAAAD